LPEIIIGDFDSIRPDVKAYYSSKGVKIAHNVDQDTTDMEKCIYYVFENSESKQTGRDSPKNVLMRDNVGSSRVLVMGAFGGRIDHTLASISLLFKMNLNFPEKCRENELLLLDSYSLMQYLDAGQNLIKPSQRYERREGVGLIPITEKCEQIRTRGLKYNMGNPTDTIHSLAFGQFISSSNSIVEDEVEVINSAPLLWCTTLRLSE